jgi:tetratricopeptide (TPR) repeat protein
MFMTFIGKTKLSVILILFSLFLISVGKGDVLQDYYSPENIRLFAEHLFDQEDYLRAAGEFQRYLFHFKSPPSDSDKILYKIGICYQKSKKYEKSLKYFREVADEFSLGQYSDCSYYQIAKTYFLLNKYNDSISYSKTKLDLMNSEKDKLHFKHLIALNYIYRKEWNKSYKFLTSNIDEKKNEKSMLLKEYAQEGMNLKKKNKVVAGVLSAIIPGAGKVYCSRPVDGLFSLLIVGVSAWKAARGFKKDGIKSAEGWTFGTLGAFFYIGNIYGSIGAVNIYNQEIEDNYFKKIELKINVFFH